MPFPRRLLTEGEEIVVDARPHWIALVGPVVVTILIVVGDRDDIAQGAPELVELVPTARLLTIAGRDHMSAVPAREFKQAALEFLTADD